jgi:hypothetical protein
MAVTEAVVTVGSVSVGPDGSSPPQPANSRSITAIKIDSRIKTGSLYIIVYLQIVRYGGESNYPILDIPPP